MEGFHEKKSVNIDDVNYFTEDYVSFLEQQIVLLHNKLAVQQSQISNITSQLQKKSELGRKSYQYIDDDIGYHDDDYDR